MTDWAVTRIKIRSGRLSCSVCRILRRELGGVHCRWSETSSLSGVGEEQDCCSTAGYVLAPLSQCRNHGVLQDGHIVGTPGGVRTRYRWSLAPRDVLSIRSSSRWTYSGLGSGGDAIFTIAWRELRFGGK